MASIGFLTLHLLLPGCRSLKEKRGRLKPLLARLHRDFNISAAEIDRQDIWQETVVGCVVISNDANHSSRLLQQIPETIEKNWPDFQLIDSTLQLL
ncbi:MAG TPA: DUF503 domain-containing protein [Chloroflexi bacterium]|nr:DUF503 domain-containing protein [Chloroflexota bacterium]HPO57418.1 DUF503 domain-containing protein [Anaerolineaceae bacterium]